ncbi:hypothetical protein [Streptomyces chrestomyceticus]|uniref:hypothetical protein n=1 Tax=Streptomyces chrestomyceticus TaxID=68185 RepID=UPI0019D07E09|nr:hypothetical protein [Streptomyces chrestomyceticus]
MTLLEREPDLTELRNAMYRLGFGSHFDFPERIPVILPREVPDSHWVDPVGDAGVGYGVAGRWDVMSYRFGPATRLGRAVCNETSNPIERQIGGEETIGTSHTFEISSTVESGFFDIVKASVTTSFSMTWSKETTFKDYLNVIIPPGYCSWLELAPVMRRLDGDFIYMRRVFGQAFIGKFSGEVDAPGVEGDLSDVIRVREAPIPGQADETLRELAEQRPRWVEEQDGVLTFPATLLPEQWSRDADTRDVTAQVRPRP